MDRPKANTKISTGTVMSTMPGGSKPSGPERWPSWNTQTSAPKLAPSDSTFMTIALTGTTTDPVIRNSRAKVASPISPRACGTRLASESRSAPRRGAGPVTPAATGRSRSRIRSTSRVATGPSLVPSGPTSNTGTVGGGPWRGPHPAPPPPPQAADPVPQPGRHRPFTGAVGDDVDHGDGGRRAGAGLDPGHPG